MTEPLTGLDEAVEAASRTREYRAGAGFDVPGDAVRAFTRAIIDAAYPIIAAAVRADERAKVLAEVEAAIRDANPMEGQFAPQWHRGLRWALDKVRALADGPTP